MIRYVASHDFSGLGQETKILYIPMTLHTWWPDHEWKICWCVFDHQIQKWETKKQRNFTLQIMTHCIHSLCEFQPHWKFYFHYAKHGILDMSKIEVVKRSYEYNLFIFKFKFKNRKIDFLVSLVICFLAEK